MICEEAMALMSAKLDGELSPEQAEALGAHLEGCPDCGGLMRAMEGLDQKLAGLREPAPEGLKKGVLYRIDQVTGKAKQPALRRWFGPGTAIGAVAAVLVLLVGLGVIPLRNRLTTGSPADEAANTAAVDTYAPEAAEPLHRYEPEAAADAMKGAYSGSISAYDANGVREPLQAPEPPPAEESSLEDSYYLSGGDNGEERDAPQPVTETLRSACAALSREEDALVLLYTEFPADSLFGLLEQEEPQLYALVEGLTSEEREGLTLYRTDCATALAVQEWLLERLPHSELMAGEAQEAEIRLRVRMEELDPECGSLYRVISWAPADHPVSWPGTWPEGWALRLRTEENWSFFFPTEDYSPNAEKPAYLAFYAAP